jgi:hypothetical protein
MKSRPTLIFFGLLILAALRAGGVSAAPAAVDEVVLAIETPQVPPDWALLERALLKANAQACSQFYARYYDQRGYLECVERWGGDDGPDDAIECMADWPLLHAIGAPDALLRMYEQGWEGHLRQWTAARTREVPFARDGMYYKEFHVMIDWLHHSEGLTGFTFQALSHPQDVRLIDRARRYAGFYMDEDPLAKNYDPRYKIIRSMFNGSRGPMLRKATALDWAGDPIEVQGRFKPLHGERNYEEMLAHFEDYNDVAGDHPSNLAATSLAMNAYMLTHEAKYKDWILEYVDAWVQRMQDNGNIIPSNIGLDGTIGGACDGKWYGGVYGWGFTVEVPQTGKTDTRTTVHLALVGLGNALLLTGDHRYVDAWRKQIETINAQGKTIDGEMQYPQSYGDDGWYNFSPHPYAQGRKEIHNWSMSPEDRKPLESQGWIRFLEGEAPNYPSDALRGDFATIQRQMQRMREDRTTPDTRLADDPLVFEPSVVNNLVNLTMGGHYTGHNAAPLHVRLRYFDPKRRRAGLPQDVAALIDRLTAEEVSVHLVNVNQTQPRDVIVQGGAYGEHQILTVRLNDREIPIDHHCFRVRLSPGSGNRLTLRARRYANRPTLAHPWDRQLAARKQ